MAIIEIKNLKKYYGRSRGIEDVSFTVEEGEIFGFIGPNGAGKSTTIRTLLALIFPASGSATIFGKDCIRYAKEIAMDVGYLPSEVFYYDNMRVIDLLKYSASFYGKDCGKRIKELAGALGLDLRKKIDDLSFGNKKKVGIVQGLIHEPKLIILDEPSIGLDPLMQRTFFDLLGEENKKGATILFSSHILSEVQKLCGRVAIIKEGRIINIDTISSLQENSYKKIALEAAADVDKAYFSFDGVTSLDVKGSTASFIYKGSVNAILRKLSALELINVSIGEPDLEEIFMHYYR
ncbi:MAG: ABC transporter ATP-binding protein [Candidatus Aminicenantes bacterium]|nr:ABC transporter ATP-binding protein [Candidatus Aminicenantes bacterium]